MMNIRKVVLCFSILMASLVVLGAFAQTPQPAAINNRDRIGLNFIRPDVNRPGNYDFQNSGGWLVDQYGKLGVQWNRLAFSWVLVQPKKDEFDWSAYDRIVDDCMAQHIQILATLGGHFDSPPVPLWAGTSLAEVLADHPEYLENFVRAWVNRYKAKIHYWEILNEPAGQHPGLTLRAYVEGVLKPSYCIIKAADRNAKVLPCAYNHLPGTQSDSVDAPSREAFWDLARGYYDIANVHEYADWNVFRTQATAGEEQRDLRNFREMMERHGEGKKLFWVTEIGWWGSGSLGNKFEVYRQDPESGMEFKPAYTGREILEHPVVLREDTLRAKWMEDLVPRLSTIPGFERVFLWVSLDEFEGGFNPDKLYGESGAKSDLWGIIAGDKTWRKSAFTLQKILRQ